MQQTISISLTTGSCSETFRILNVYRDDDKQQLIVVSKLSPPMGRFMLGLASYGNPKATAEVSVEQELPLKHYVIGLRSTQQELLPKWPYTAIKNQDEIPAHEKANCLFENEYTEEKEAQRRKEVIEREDQRLAERQAERAAREANEAKQFCASLVKYGMFAAGVAGGIALLVAQTHDPRRPK